MITECWLLHIDHVDDDTYGLFLCKDDAIRALADWARMQSGDKPPTTEKCQDIIDRFFYENPRHFYQITVLELYSSNYLKYVT